MNLDDIQALPQHLRLTIPDAYLDIFEHMNVQYYLKIFSNSVFDMFDDFGMDEAFFQQNNVAMYAVDQRLSFRAEVKAGEIVATFSRLIARSDKKLHFMIYMINESQNTLAATMEGLGFHISRETKRSASFLPSVTPIIDSRLQEHQALNWEVQLSQAIKVTSV